MRHQGANFLGDKKEIIDHVFRLAGKALAQFRVLGGDTDRAGVQVALAHHDAALDDQGCGGKAELVCPKQGTDDDVASEHILRQVLDQQSDHSEAGASLASMLIERGETDEAMIVLGRLAPDSEVDRLQSAARLKASSGQDLSELEAKLAADNSNEDARIDLAKALAARSEFEPALDHLLVVVRAKGPKKEDARVATLDIFGVLGDEHPLTQTYRRQLATALF